MLTRLQLRKLIIESVDELEGFDPNRLKMLEKVKNIYQALYGVDKYDPGEINDSSSGDMGSIISFTTNWMINKVRSESGSKKKAILVFNPSTLYTSKYRGFYVNLKSSMIELETPDNQSIEKTNYVVRKLIRLAEVILGTDDLFTSDNRIKHPNHLDQRGTLSQVTVPDLMKLGVFFKNVYSLASDLGIDTNKLEYYGQSEEGAQNVVKERHQKLKATFGI